MKPPSSAPIIRDSALLRLRQTGSLKHGRVSPGNYMIFVVQESLLLTSISFPLKSEGRKGVNICINYLLWLITKPRFRNLSYISVITIGELPALVGRPDPI